MPKERDRFVDSANCECEFNENFATQYAKLKHQYDLIERKETRRHQEFIEELTPSLNRTDEIFYKNADAVLLKKILSVLRRNDRALFITHYIDNVSMTEIAKAEGVTRSAISQRLSRIRKRIIELWQKS